MKALYSLHEDAATVGVLLFTFIFTSGLVSLTFGLSTKPLSDHFVALFFALLACAASFGCIALSTSTRHFDDDEKDENSEEQQEMDERKDHIRG